MPTLIPPRAHILASSIRGRFRPSMLAISGIYTTNLALVLIGAATGVLTARSLGASGKGEVAIAQAVVGTVTFILTLSVDQAYVFIASKASTPPLMRRAIRDGFALGALVGSLTAISASVLGDRLPGGAILYILTAISVPFGTSGLFAVSVLQGRKDFRLWNALRFIPAAGYLSALIAVVAVNALTPVSVTICYVAGAILFWLITVASTRRELLKDCQRTGERLLPTVAVTRQLLHYGARTHVSAVQNLLNQRADIFLMAFFTTTAVVGRYSVAVSVVAPLAMIGPAVASYLFPKLAASGSTAAIGIVLKRVATVALLCAVSWAIVSPALVGPVFGREFAGLGITLTLLCAATVPLCLGYTLFAWWKGQGRPQQAAWAEGAAVVIMAGLLPWLVSHYQAAGAAAVSLASYTTSFVVVYAMYQRSTRKGTLSEPHA